MTGTYSVVKLADWYLILGKKYYKLI
jgi:hypothetical protein